MRILQMSHGHSVQRFTVLLDPSEVSLSNQQLIDLADARGDPERAKQIYNFGGEVERRIDGTARITVYID